MNTGHYRLAWFCFTFLNQSKSAQPERKKEQFYFMCEKSRKKRLHQKPWNKNKKPLTVQLKPELKPISVENIYTLWYICELWNFHPE